MVYRYYFINRLKQRYPHMSFCDLLHWTWRWTFLGPPPEPKSSAENTSNTPKFGSLFFSLLQSNEKSADIDRSSFTKQHDVDATSELDSMDFSSSREDDCAIVEKHGHVKGVADDFFGQEPPQDQYLMDFLSADLLMSYGDFPNTITEEPVMITAQFPTMIGRNSYYAKPTPGFANATQDDFSPRNTGDDGQYPTIIEDDDFD
jgi:hypothetical protein